MVNSRLSETERPRDVKTPRRKITRKREFESYHKRFQDSEIGPNFSETQVFRGTFFTPNYSRWFSGQGGLAQMVERPLCMREVLGSIPRFSILFFFKLTVLAAMCIRK